MSSSIFRQNLLASTIVATGLFIGAPAFAQVAPQEAAPSVAAAAQQSDDESTIVVTGTLIKNPNLVASSPVSVVGSEEIGLRQSNTAEEILRTIPGTVPGIGSNVNNGNGGAATLNLRGLGANRNIVLLNGTRLTPFGLSGTVDTNNIPLALIDRVDVLTGGASTTYGADAVSGVVNFITKKDFAGFEADISNSLTEDGDGHTVRTDLTLGANFDDGRGNATLSVGYQKQDPIYQGARPYGIFALSPTLGDTTGAGSGTSVPARFSLPARNAASPGGAANAGTYQIDPATGAFTTSTAFTSFNFNPTNVYQTPFLRYNIYGQAHYQLSEGIEAYAEALFSKQTVSTIIASSGVFTQALTIRYNNPFIPATALQQICNANGLTAGQCNAAAAIPLSTAPQAVTSGAGANAFITNAARRFVESGTRNSDRTTTFFQQKAGFRGAITSTLNYDVSGTYGQSDLQSRSTGQGLTSRLVQELDPTSTTTCRVGGTCVPINLFGAAGTITPGATNYLNVSTTIGTRTSLAQARGVINGDFGVSSPWASNPIGIAAGVEYRKYTASNVSDLPSQTPGEVLGAGGATPDTSGKYDVKEAFAEVIAPIIEDRPFFKSLSIEGGVRRSDYSSIGKNTTWKVGGNWQPVDGVKFRGNYQRAVRAPNIGELFAPVVTGLTSLVTDPCQGAAPTTNANLRAICIAQGAPAATIGNIAKPSAGQVNQYGGGNPNLKAEVAKTYTFGGVFQPSFVPGLSVTADYYHIAVSGAITTPTTGDVISACFGNITAASATSVACTSIIRDPLTGTFNGSAATVPGLPLPLSNLGRILTDGIDLTANYRRDIGFGVLNVGFDGNWTHRSLFQATPSSVNRECVGHYSVNCSLSGSIQPKFSWSQRTTLTIGDFDLSLLWRHINKESAESTVTVAGVTTQVFGKNAGFFNGNATQDGFSTIPSFNYFDFTARANVSDHLTLTATVDNLFDKQPPIVGQGIGTQSFNSGNTYPSTYDVLGRRYLVGASIRF